MAFFLLELTISITDTLYFVWSILRDAPTLVSAVEILFAKVECIEPMREELPAVRLLRIGENKLPLGEAGPLGDF